MFILSIVFLFKFTGILTRQNSGLVLKYFFKEQIKLFVANCTYVLNWLQSANGVVFGDKNYLIMSIWIG